MKKSRFNIIYFIAVLSVLAVLGFAKASKASGPATYSMISASQIASILDEAKGQRTLVFLYTSWCPYCRKALPEIADIARDYPGRVVAVSLDKDADTLLRYVQKNYSDIPYTPYVWDRSDIFAKPLQRFGIKPGNGIPFIALLDEHGYVYKQGVLDPSEAKKYIEAEVAAP